MLPALGDLRLLSCGHLCFDLPVARTSNPFPDTKASLPDKLGDRTLQSHDPRAMPPGLFHEAGGMKRESSESI